MSEPFVHTTQHTLAIHDWMEKDPNLTVGFTSRKGGVSQSPFDTMNVGLHVKDHQEAVLENRKILANAIGFPMENWVIGEQIHHTNVAIVDNQDKGKGAFSQDTVLKEVDGLITNKSGLLCAAFFADCVPIYFYDPVTKWIGIAHAGWKGTVGQIAKQVVNKLEVQGVDPATLLAAIGPCISGTVYEVDEKVIAAVPAELFHQAVSRKSDSKALLDLRALNRGILLQSGIQPQNISVTSYCTYQDKDLFYSHRRDHGKTGRMLGFIGYK